MPLFTFLFFLIIFSTISMWWGDNYREAKREIADRDAYFTANPRPRAAPTAKVRIEPTLSRAHS